MKCAFGCRVKRKSTPETLRIRQLVVFLFIFAGAVCSAVPDDHDRDLADAYVQTFLNVHNTIPGPDLLKTALEFYPAHGDALYLLGKHPEIPKKEAIGYLEQALNADYWSEYSLQKAGIELFKLYNQLKRYAAAGVLLTGYSLDFYTNPEDALLLTEYYRKIGDTDKYASSAGKGYSLWYEYFVAHKVRLDSEFRGLLFQRLRDFPEFDPGVNALEALFPYASNDEDLSGIILTRYVQSGTFSPYLHAYSVLDGQIEKEEMLFVLPYGSVIKEISSRTDAAAMLEEAYAQFSGVVEYDWNDDSFYEESLIFSDGAVTRHIFDPDQDGIADSVFDFGLSMNVSRAEYRYAGMTRTISYTDYPFVDTIVVQGTSSVTYVFDQTVLPVIEPAPYPFLPGKIIMKTGKELDEFCTAESVSAVSDNMMYTSAGENSEYSIDVNENGNPEYRMIIEGLKIIQKWDTDDNGTPDIVQTVEGDKKKLQLFDYTVVLNKGVPVELTYKGDTRELRINDGIVWINTLPVPGIRELDPRGYFSYKNRNYYAYLFEEYLFVQPVGNNHE